MKSKLLFSVFVFPLILLAQVPQNQWVWTGGSKYVDSDTIQVFRLKGIEDETNYPGMRRGANGILDNDGNYLMFGGQDERDDHVNQFWSFNNSNENWNYKSGLLRRIDNYLYSYSRGIGISHWRNSPVARVEPVMWKDLQGDIWLFGYPYNNLWKYDTSVEEWVEMKERSEGDEPVYGTMGVESPSNYPPAVRHAFSWTDSEGNLWMYGGDTGIFDISMYFYHFFYSGLWKFNTQTNAWTWMGGYSETDEPAYYDIQGEESPLNYPGARSNGVAWVGDDGYFYLFGGVGRPQYPDPYYNERTHFNDTWKLNPQTGQWTWLKGNPSSTAEVEVPNSGEHPLNIPSGYYQGHKAPTWVDSDGMLWLFTIHFVQGQPGNTTKMWRYNPETNNWMKFRNFVTYIIDYGIKGEYSENSTPGMRYWPQTWASPSGELYLYGGIVPSVTNRTGDLWKYNTEINQWMFVDGLEFGSDHPDYYLKVKLEGIPADEVHPGNLQSKSA